MKDFQPDGRDILGVFRVSDKSMSVYPGSIKMPCDRCERQCWVGPQLVLIRRQAKNQLLCSECIAIVARLGKENKPGGIPVRSINVVPGQDNN